MKANHAIHPSDRQLRVLRITRDSGRVGSSDAAAVYALRNRGLVTTSGSYGYVTATLTDAGARLLAGADHPSDGGVVGEPSGRRAAGAATMRKLASRKGALRSWANTVDRTRRTAPARASGPGEIDWHLQRLPAAFDLATEAQRVAAADAARRAYYVGLAMCSARTRRRGR